MPSNNARLSVLTFPQTWDPDAVTIGTATPGAIDVRILTLPKSDPLAPLDLAAEPAFAETDLTLDAVFVAGLASMPVPGATATRVPLTIDARPQRADLFETLGDLFKIAPAPAVQPAGAMRVLKYLTPGYRAASGMRQPRTPMALVDSAYQCALRDGPASPPAAAPPTDSVTWGQVIGYALRQPLLAEALGLLHIVRVPLDPALVRDGGWLYVDVRAGTTYAAAAAGVVARYAARIPALPDRARPLFASALFPVVAAPPGNYDPVFIEAEAYSDGFAKIVHGAQPISSAIIDTNRGALPPVRDLGIRLAWDDEQITMWMNRQVGLDPETGVISSLEAPMGVMGYRVDVRLAPDDDNAAADEWTPLTRVRGPIALEDFDLGVFDGELHVDVLPISVRAQNTGDYWLPAYFTAWAGGSIVLSDRNAYRLTGQDAIADAGPYIAVDADAVPLAYGNDYEFRVRLADLSGGGPTPDARAENPAPRGTTVIPFRRHVPPKSVEPGPVVFDADGATARCTVKRPRLSYPDALFTGQAGALDALQDDADALRALHDELGDEAPLREVSIPDPDVQWIEISVAAVGPALDPAHPDGLTPIYTARREMQGDTLELEFAFVDRAQIATMEAPGDAGPLPVPSGRRLRVALRAVAREDPDLEYFGSEEARFGPVSDAVYITGVAAVEANVWIASPDQDRLQAILLQPGAEERLARQLDLEQSGLTLSGRRGRRVVFGCVPQLRHTIAPDGGSITIGATADLAQRWIVAIRLTLNRDWTWDGLDVDGIAIGRAGAGTIGNVRLPRSLPPRAAESPDRTQADLIFFDVIDPQPTPPKRPEELTLTYSVLPNFPAADASAAAWAVTMRLPVAARPTQTPQLVSAGVAMSPYVAAPNYSFTEIRDRRVWLEFDRPPDDPRDKYFARLVAYAPDPVLLDLPLEPRPDPPDAPFALDPEPIRVITPGQSADAAGLGAMIPLETDGTGTRCLLPLPDGLDADSPELFGFFVYEIRLGHDRQRWCTAQGRYGPPLRVVGVQHPAPPLLCTVHRTPDHVRASAPHATPVVDGHSVLPRQPRTDIWVLLYAQVVQTDGASRRNVLLLRQRAELVREEDRHVDARYATRAALFSSVRFMQQDVEDALAVLSLPKGSPLSVVAVEMMPQDSQWRVDPLGLGLGKMRVLRTSPLTAVPAMCVRLAV